MEVATKIHRLTNQIRLATVEMPQMESVAIGIWTEAGSRHETTLEHGMAHLVEHLLFKGTASRSAMDISRQIERLGGSIDAYTVEDHTCYHTRGPAETTMCLLDVMSDLYQNPVFDPKEIESEKRVIREEIAMVTDQPAQLLEDLISEAVWGKNHPLGRSITGTEESLAGLTRNAVFDFFNRAYSGRQTVISVAGKIDHQQIADAVAERFRNLRQGKPLSPMTAPGIQAGQSFREMDDREQSHLAIAFRSADRFDPDRFSQKILNILLGENMSSRLFQNLREKLGLCYEIQSETVSFSDAGMLQIYLALDPDNLSQALPALSKTFATFCKKAPRREKVDEAVSYCIGQSRIHLETVLAQMMWAGECLLSFDQWISPDSIYENLRAVTPQAVQASARKIFNPAGCSIALTGPAEAIQQARAWAGK
jgi:predicted Zn-dependent peptidase